MIIFVRVRDVCDQNRNQRKNLRAVAAQCYTLQLQLNAQVLIKTNRFLLLVAVKTCSKVTHHISLCQHDLLY